MAQDFGGHLADHQVQERDDDQGQHEPTDIGEPHRRAPARDRRGEPVVHSGFGHRAQRQGAHGDAELRAGEQHRQFRGRPQRGPAERLCVAASSSRCRRAAMSANSEATKNALAAISATVTNTTVRGLLMGLPLGVGARCGVHRYEYQCGNSFFDDANLGVQLFSGWGVVSDEVGGVGAEINDDAVTDAGQHRRTQR